MKDERIEMFEQHIAEVKAKHTLQKEEIASAVSHRIEMARIAEENLEEYKQSNDLTRVFREKILMLCERETAALERIANVLEFMQGDKHDAKADREEHPEGGNGAGRRD